MWSPNALFLLVGVWLLFIKIRGTRSLAVAHGGWIDGLRKLFGRSLPDVSDSAGPEES